MLRTIKKRIQDYQQRLGATTPVMDDEGRAVIQMTVYDDSTFLSPYSHHKPSISNDVAAFLDHEMRTFRPKHPLHIQICSNQIDEKEQKIYDQAIRNYYETLFIDRERDSKRLWRMSLFLFLFSCLIFCGMYFLEQFKIRPFFIEIIDIFGWVFTWEAVDMFFLERNYAHVEQLRYVHMIEAKITYHPLLLKED